MAGTLYQGYIVEATVNAADQNHTVIRALEVYDATLLCQTSVINGTIAVRKATTAVTNTMVCDTAGNITRAGTLTAAQRSFAVGDVMNFFTNATGAVGLVTVKCVVTGSGVAG